MRLTVSRGPSKLSRLLLLVEHLLALAVQEEERGGVNLGQTHAVTRIDAEAAERALFRLEHHCRCAKTREAQRGGCVSSRTTGDASAGRAGESHEKCVCPLVEGLIFTVHRPPYFHRLRSVFGHEDNNSNFNSSQKKADFGFSQSRNLCVDSTRLESSTRSRWNGATSHGDRSRAHRARDTRLAGQR